MAFDYQKLVPLGNTSAPDVAPSAWMYRTTDSNADVNTEGYFNDAHEKLNVGDHIHATHFETDGSVNSAYVYIVLEVTEEGVVDVSDGTALTTTDTD